jgi:hypothetical protein
MRRIDVLNSLPVSPDSFVVEIGAGPTPFKHTKLILDKYPFENTERHGDIVNIAPVIKADAVRIPLADQACDLLFISHVLEHVPRPDLVLAEAKRCARFVYLEFPSRVRELMYAWSFHKWLVEIENGALTFYRNDIPQLCGDFFHKHYDFLLDVWSDERFPELNGYLYAETSGLAFAFSARTALEHVLETSASGKARTNYRSQYGASGTGATAYSRGLLLKTMLWTVSPDPLIRARRKRQDRVNATRKQELTDGILSKLRCQRCLISSLTFADSSSRSIILCGACQAEYRRERGVFDFDVYADGSANSIEVGP